MTWSTRSPGMGSIDSMYRSAMCCCFDGGMTVALQPPHHCSASKHDCHAQVDDMYVTRSVAMLLTMHPSSSHLMSKRCSSDTKGNRMLCCIACSVALQSQLGGWQTSEGSEQKCMQRGELYERTYRRGDRSINSRGGVAGANNTRKHLGSAGNEFGWIWVRWGGWDKTKLQVA